MTTYGRPAVIDIYRVLREQNGLIVHFSGCPKGAGEARLSHLYPNDLRFVIDGRAFGGVSCSVVKPGDRFHGFNQNHALGTIGVVVGLSAPQSLLEACATDCGSREVKPGVRAPWPFDMPLSHVEHSIYSRREDGYNEWVVANYRVLGIFVAQQVTVTRLKKISVPALLEDLAGTELVPAFCDESLSDIRAEFRDMRIFTFGSGNILELNPGGWSAVRHSQIYV